MRDPLSSAKLKVARAEEHLHSLVAEGRAFMQDNPYAVRAQLDRETSCVVFTAERVNDPPPRLGVIVGDFVHNLRSALDHVAWQLACLHYGREPTGKTRRAIAFPVAGVYADFIAHKALVHLHFDHVAFIEGYQPYRGGKKNPFTFLHDLWNADKHRVVPSVGVTLGAYHPPTTTTNPRLVILETWVDAGVEVKPGTKVMCVRLGWRGDIADLAQLGQYGVNMNALPIDIAFGERRVRIEELPVMLDAVKTVISQCQKRFFP